jgi:hypothetical protein
MAWQTELPIIIRHLIDDLNETPTYNDNRLVELILVCAQLLQQEVSFEQIFIVDVDEYTISPDPTNRNANTRDDGFISLVCLKCASILTRSEFRISAGQGIAIKDGASSIDLKGVAQSKKQVADFYQNTFEEAKLCYVAGSRTAGEIIVTPFKLNSYNTIIPNYYNNRMSPFS